MLSMQHDEPTAACRLYVELSCRLHVAGDNLWQTEDQETTNTSKDERKIAIKRIV